MRRITADQKHWLKRLAQFWTGKGAQIKKPWRHQLGDSGSVEVQWLGLKPSDRCTTTIGVIMDFAEENGMEVKWSKVKDIKGVQFMFRRNYPSTPFVLTIHIPGGEPKRKRVDEEAEAEEAQEVSVHRTRA